MDDVVAVEIRCRSGAKCYLLTWGRIQDAVDPAPLEALVLRHTIRFAIPGDAVSAHVCLSLQAAASQPYFYECFFSICQKKIPFGPKYRQWQQEMAQAMEAGKELYYLGNPEKYQSLLDCWDEQT